MNDTDTVIAGLRRELAALQQRVASLESRAASKAPITCSALTVVDANKNPVATIDANGFLQCRRVMVTDRNGNSLHYDPPFGELVLSVAGVPVVRINEHALGAILLSAPSHSHTKSQARLCPEPAGGSVELWDSSGKRAIWAGFSSAGASAEFQSRDPQAGTVKLGVDGSGSGQITVIDANGTITARLPA